MYLTGYSVCLAGFGGQLSQHHRCQASLKNMYLTGYSVCLAGFGGQLSQRHRCQASLKNMYLTGYSGCLAGFGGHLRSAIDVKPVWKTCIWPVTVTARLVSVDNFSSATDIMPIWKTSSAISGKGLQLCGEAPVYIRITRVPAWANSDTHHLNPNYNGTTKTWKLVTSEKREGKKDCNFQVQTDLKWERDGWGRQGWGRLMKNQ